MNNFKEYDITTLFPGSMRACSMRDAGALWSYSEFDESMGMYFSLLNGCWLLDSSIYGDDQDDLFLIPAYITCKDEPEQYVVVSETTLRQTLSLLNSGQSCVWDSSELPEHRYITQVYAKDTAPEEKVFVGELSSNLSGAPSDDDLKRVKDVFKGTGLAFYLIGKLKKSQVFLYMFQKRDKLYKYYSSVCSYQRFFRVPTTDQTESLARFVPGFLFDHMLILFL